MARRTAESRLPEPTQQPASPLLNALIAARRLKTPEAEATYYWHRERVERLKDPDTPWAERLRLIEELEVAGWGTYAEWPRLKRDWKYGGKEWQIRLAPKQLKSLDALEGQKYSTYLAAIYQKWFKDHPELQERILADLESLHFFATWVACQVWGRDEGYSRWLTKEIVDKAIKGIDPPSSGIYRADDTTRDPEQVPRQAKQDLRHEGYVHLISGIIPGHVHYVNGSLGAYWRKCVKNFILDCIQRAGWYARSLNIPAYRETDTGLPDEEGPTRQYQLWDVADLEEFNRSMDRLDAARVWGKLRGALTPRQQQIVWLKGEPRPEGRRTDEEVAAELEVSLSTVEKEWKVIRKKLERLGVQVL